jgi:hypothetical protein
VCLQRVNHRRVLSEDAQGNRTVEVDQTGAWRFLMFRGTFTVRLHVTQRRQERLVSGTGAGRVPAGRAAAALYMA